MMKLLMMLLPWIMAKLDQVIEYLLRKNREEACSAKGKRDGDA